MRLRHSQDRGSGRAEEVVAAIADEIGMAIGSGTADPDLTAAISGVAPDSRPAADRRPEVSGFGDTRVDHPAAPQSDARRPSRPALEILRPVRERLWLAPELP
jgi:hypothetical protein